VAEHHGLRGARRARGVDERGEALGLDRLDALVHFLLARRVTAREEVVPRHHACARAVETRAAHRHDVLERWELAPSRLDLAQLALVLDEHERGLGVLEDVVHLVGRARRVDARRCAAGGHRREIEDRPLRPVEAEDADPLTRLEPQRDERARRLHHLGRVLCVRGRAPRAAALGEVGRTIGVRLGGTEEPRGDRLGQGVLRGRRLYRNRPRRAGVLTTLRLEHRPPPGWFLAPLSVCP
jgi:hypothetical protein